MSIKTNHIENRRIVGGDYFKLLYGRKSNKCLEEYLLKFNINDYWILKCSNRFRIVSEEEFLTFKYCSYTFLKKEIYDKVYIEEWLNFMTVNNIMIMFLNKPFPPIYIKKMMKVIDEY